MQVPQALQRLRSSRATLNARNPRRVQILLVRASARRGVVRTLRDQAGGADRGRDRCRLARKCI